LAEFPFAILIALVTILDVIVRKVEQSSPQTVHISTQHAVTSIIRISIIVLVILVSSPVVLVPRSLISPTSSSSSDSSSSPSIMHLPPPWAAPKACSVASSCLSEENKDLMILSIGSPVCYLNSTYFARGIERILFMMNKEIIL
jgi:hypothetical protein